MTADVSVVGAGLATAISNTVGCIFLLVVVFRSKDTVIVLNPVKFRWIPDDAREVVLVGLPSAINIVLGSTSNIILTHFMSAYGDIAVAAFGIVQKVSTVVIHIALGVSQGIMPMLGFSFGTGNVRRVKQIVKWSAIILAVYAVIAFGLAR